MDSPHRDTSSSLRTRIPYVSSITGSSKEVEQAPAAWDLARFTAAAIDLAGSRELDARSKALVNALADEHGTLAEPRCRTIWVLLRAHGRATSAGTLQATSART